MTTAYSPQKLAEALELMAATPRPVVMAGCTDLVVVDHAQNRQHAAALDVLRLSELRGISDVGSHLDIGAATTFSQLRCARLVQKHVPVLVEVAATIGAWQIQNRATIGGNIANASPA